MKQAHVSGKLMARLASFYTDTAKVESYTSTPDNIGEEGTLTWTTVTGMGAIPCRVWPLVGTEEAKGMQETVRTQSHSASLQGEWAILPTMRVTIGSDVFDVVGVQSDSEHIATHLALSQVNV